MLDTIKVTYEATNKPYHAIQILQSLPDLAAFDFEAACIYTAKEQAKFAEIAQDESIDIVQRRYYNVMSKATALSHPSMVELTHLAIGISESEGYVLILDTDRMRKLVLNWLTTTEVTQIWHNASYDFKHIYFHTHKFPKNYEDTQQLAKSIVNHVEVFKAKVGLKDLKGTDYGAWGISADYFDQSQMYNKTVLEYAATDGCATYSIWQDIQRYLKEIHDENIYSL